MLFLVLHCTCGGIVIAECIFEEQAAKRLGTRDDEEILGGLDMEGHLKVIISAELLRSLFLLILRFTESLQHQSTLYFFALAFESCVSR
jgi:hypothetical protein